jgi:hypothetical protein
MKTYLSGELEPLTDIESINDVDSSNGDDSDDSSSSFPIKLRNHSCGHRHKIQRLKSIKNAALKEFHRFRYSQCQHWSVDDASVGSTGFLGNVENAENLPSCGSSPAEHLKNLETSGYEKIILEYV